MFDIEGHKTSCAIEKTTQNKITNNCINYEERHIVQEQIQRNELIDRHIYAHKFTDPGSTTLRESN